MSKQNEEKVPFVDLTHHGQDKQAIEDLKHEIESFKKECNEFSFLAVGKTGAGKSTLLNALTGTHEFNSSGDRSKAGTTYISSYQFQRNGVKITAWDSPGFEDGSGKEEDYKKELRKQCSDVDLVLYCISLKINTSDLNDDASSLKQITEAFTVDVWKKSVVVLTYANKLNGRLSLSKTDGFKKKIEEWQGKIQEALINVGVSDKVAKEIPVIPAGRVELKHLPGYQFWLSFLWCTMFHTVKDVRAQLALIKSNEDRFVDESAGETSSDTALVVTTDNLAIAAGSAAGTAAGATTGALIGALAIGIPSFGVAAGVGLVLGFFIGGTIGSGAGVGVGKLIKWIRDKKKS